MNNLCLNIGYLDRHGGFGVSVFEMLSIRLGIGHLSLNTQTIVKTTTEINTNHTNGAFVYESLQSSSFLITSLSLLQIGSLLLGLLQAITL